MKGRNKTDLSRAGIYKANQGHFFPKQLSVRGIFFPPKKEGCRSLGGDEGGCSSVTTLKTKKKQGFKKGVWKEIKPFGKIYTPVHYTKKTKKTSISKKKLCGRKSNLLEKYTTLYTTTLPFWNPWDYYIIIVRAQGPKGAPGRILNQQELEERWQQTTQYLIVTKNHQRLQYLFKLPI